ncbi:MULTISPECIES: hypothetical protein [unclassified Paenibacillus]|uniref:hypothetical protein n=1 Tax=unclassified Paenibacillus TaxID=185978 RepID=UPI001AE817F4|nr:MULTISPECIES: hypothetical protein [unclassified Paenibacillus]MBP1153712.1 catechol 2,3-dioxygenase-like lactoylglutathione lyase family enzyme [Paenibacillus sp. PvP091]MBP1170903.1 catechol 2,3-dioxygenase-like lactoylglutathione lyase family enzyme [Paenibacillus sp. PvR098]MBP2441931.1 catechol 2,3-dioxygenase-like lactoylglutathione lyase family enzyme [Paenibacillus sp. PvP052]
MGIPNPIEHVLGIRFVVSSSNFKESIRFYGETLGLKEISSSSELIRYNIGGMILDIIPRTIKKEKQNQLAISLSDPHILFEVDPARYEQIKWLLIREDITLLELSDLEGRNKMFFKDPDGNLNAILSG